jgi:hypothetical protein
MSNKYLPICSLITKFNRCAVVICDVSMPKINLNNTIMLVFDDTSRAEATVKCRYANIRRGDLE